MKTIQFRSVVLYLLLLTLFYQTSWANANTQTINFPEEKISTRLERMNQLGKATGQSVSYNKGISYTKELPAFTAQTDDMEEWLYYSLQETPYDYRKIRKGYYSVYHKSPAPEETTGSSTAPDQQGTLSGKVMDEHGEVIPGATIRVQETNKGASSGLGGDYTIDLPAGTYTITVSLVGFQTTEIKGVKISGGKNTPLDITLTESSTILGEVVVTATYDDASAKGLYARQKNMTAMSDGISASMIKRTSDNNIAQSLRRVSGVTISGGKHVTVRGMSDRYNNVTLNGSSLPSTEANQRNFSFDIIPTGLVDNITISKTFTPDLPGEFSGGLVEIKTLAVPEKKFFSLSLGTGMNTQSTGKPFFMNQRYTSDWFLGGVKDRVWYAGRDNEEQSMKNAAQKNNYDMWQYRGAPTQNYSTTFGLPFEWGKHHLGVVGALTYRHDENSQETLEGVFADSKEYTKPYGIEALKSTSHSFMTHIGAVLNLGWTMPRHKVTLRNLFNNRFSHDSYVRFISIPDNFTPPFISYFNKSLQNTIFQSQLEGEHKFTKRDIKFTWLASYNRLDRTNPDNRLINGSVIEQIAPEEVLIYWQSNMDPQANQYDASNGHTMYAQYQEDKSNLGINLEFPFVVSGNLQSLKTGYLGTFRTANFEQLYIRVVQQRTYNPDAMLPLSVILAPKEFEDNLKYVPTGVQPRDHYTGKQSIHAPYLMGTFSFFKKLQLIAGVRAEMNDMELKQYLFLSDKKNESEDEVIPRKSTDWLPSVTTIYSIISDLNLRASYSKTIARPDFREIARLDFYDPDSRSEVLSYPVNQSQMHNWDARLEWYPEPGEVLSLAYFYKKFIEPIETIQDSNINGVRLFVRNMDEATIKGIEFNWRKSFGFISPNRDWLRNLYFIGNFTWLRGSIYSDYLKLTNNSTSKEYEHLYQRNRLLQGLSPLVFNMGLLYEGDIWGASLHYNQTGRKLVYAGRFAEFDIYDNARGVLDLQVYGRFLGQRMELKLNATDLLNQDIIRYGMVGVNMAYNPIDNPEVITPERRAKGYDYREGDHVYSRVKKGIGLSMSVSYKF